MLRTMKSLRGRRLQATDGEIGKVEDVYFDDENWRVRYIVADTSNWLTGRMVLLLPATIGKLGDDERALPVSLTMKQIEESPSTDSDKPVSRIYESELHVHYGLAPYWSKGSPPPVKSEGGARAGARGDTATATEESTHLRSGREVTGYDIEATDGGIGHVEDFIIDTDDWSVRYMEVDTKKWLGGRKVLVSPNWITSIEWADRIVRVDMTREQIEGSPEFDPKGSLSREYESQLFGHYERPRYW